MPDTANNKNYYLNKMWAQLAILQGSAMLMIAILLQAPKWVYAVIVSYVVLVLILGQERGRRYYRRFKGEEI